MDPEGEPLGGLETPEISSATLHRLPTDEPAPLGDDLLGGAVFDRQGRPVEELTVGPDGSVLGRDGKLIPDLSVDGDGILQSNLPRIDRPGDGSTPVDPDAQPLPTSLSNLLTKPPENESTSPGRGDSEPFDVNDLDRFDADAFDADAFGAVATVDGSSIGSAPDSVEAASFGAGLQPVDGGLSHGGQGPAGSQPQPRMQPQPAGGDAGGQGYPVGAGGGREDGRSSRGSVVLTEDETIWGAAKSTPADDPGVID